MKKNPQMNKLFIRGFFLDLKQFPEALENTLNQ